MLYLSQLILDCRSRAVRRDLNDCHHLHRTILAGFPQAPAGTSAREYFGLLYRLEPVTGTPRLARLIVQSNIPADWSHLPVDYLSSRSNTSKNPTTRLVSVASAQIDVGVTFQFRLRANPTRRISQRNAAEHERWRGKRVELRTQTEQIAWLARKGEQHGFRLMMTTTEREVPVLEAGSLEKARGERVAHAEKPALPLCFGAVLFSGCLQVCDREVFFDALRRGIGAGKAFGFGLLSIDGYGG